MSQRITSQRITRKGMRRAGFSLVEVILACSVLAVVVLGLSSTIASGQKMMMQAREQSVVMNAVKKWIEDKRLQCIGTTDMTIFLTDTSYPVIDSTQVKNAVTTIFTCTDETGANWYAVPRANGVPAASTSQSMTSGDTTAFGYTSGGRDLIGNGSFTNTNCDPTKILIVPVKIVVTWMAGSDQGTRRQNWTTYVFLGPS